MRNDAADLARRLGEHAEAVCRQYLPQGRRHGAYWTVGDVQGAPGRSLFVRLREGESRPAGKWTDAATGEHGDLLDLIAANGALSFRDTLDEARRFLALPTPEHADHLPVGPKPLVGSLQAAQRLLAASRPIAGTLAETYLHGRGLTHLRALAALRFHPRCFYRPNEGETVDRQAWPALIAAVTDLDGHVTGVHRTWLAPDGRAKAPLATPRKAMGVLHGHAVRFGCGDPVADGLLTVLAAGEGVETVLSVRAVLPNMPMVAALSSAHLAALKLPPSLRRLYILVDDDPAGHHGAEVLGGPANALDVDTRLLHPTLGDFNDDLVEHGPEALASSIRSQLAPEDVERFCPAPGAGPSSSARSSSSRPVRRRSVRAA